MKNLVLLTNGYPFGNGETFIETEIIKLAQNYKKVTIISVANNFQNCRKLPDNCMVLGFRSRIKLIRIPLITFILLTHLKLFLKLTISEYKYLNPVYGITPNIDIIAKLFLDLIKGFNLYDFIKKQAFESAVFYSYWLDQKALALAIYKEKTSALCVSRAHGSDLYFERNPTNYLSFQKHKLKSLDRVFTISKQGKNYLLNKVKCGDSKVVVSRLGVKLPQNIMNYKSGNVKVLVSCSMVTPVKRIELVIKALAKINNPSIHWIHIGGGPLFKEIEALAIKELAKTNHRFQFMGMLTNDEVYQFYSQTNIDAFLNVSESEGIPVSIMEAMAFGIPVLATNVGGTSELVDTNSGVLLPKELSTEQLKNELEYFLTLSEPVLKNYRVNARRKVETHYDANHNYNQFIEELNAL